MCIFARISPTSKFTQDYNYAVIQVKRQFAPEAEIKHRQEERQFNQLLTQRSHLLP